MQVVFEELCTEVSITNLFCMKKQGLPSLTTPCLKDLRLTISDFKRDLYFWASCNSTSMNITTNLEDIRAHHKKHHCPNGCFSPHFLPSITCTANWTMCFGSFCTKTSVQCNRSLGDMKRSNSAWSEMQSLILAMF